MEARGSSERNRGSILNRIRNLRLNAYHIYIPCVMTTETRVQGSDRVLRIEVPSASSRISSLPSPYVLSEIGLRTSITIWRFEQDRYPYLTLVNSTGPTSSIASELALE